MRANRPTPKNGYVFEEILGCGAFADVWLARKCGKAFAIKICSSIQHKDKHVLMETEFAKTFKTSCPFILEYVDVFTDAQFTFIVTEYCENGDLSCYIKKQIEMEKRFLPSDIMKIFIQLTLALRELHQQHYLHRDVKAENVFLCKDGNVKLGDFGCCKLLLGNLKTHTLIGMMNYLSPEMIKENSYDFPTDIWSFGVLMYYFCTFRMPFEGVSFAVIQAIVDKPPMPIPTEFCPPEITRIIYSMLEKDPDKRPTADQLLNNPFVLRYARELDLLKFYASGMNLVGTKELLQREWERAMAEKETTSQQRNEAFDRKSNAQKDRDCALKEGEKLRRNASEAKDERKKLDAQKDIYNKQIEELSDIINSINQTVLDAKIERHAVLGEAEQFRREKEVAEKEMKAVLKEREAAIKKCEEWKRKRDRADVQRGDALKEKNEAMEKRANLKAVVERKYHDLRERGVALLQSLSARKDAAMRREDFDEAKQWRRGMERAEEILSQVAEVERMKDRCVMKEDYIGATQAKKAADDQYRLLELLAEGKIAEENQKHGNEVATEDKINTALKSLAARKEEAVRKEEFDAAKVYKIALERLKKVGEELAVLEERKMQCVEAEDYEGAKQAKDRISYLYTQADALAQGRLPEDGEGNSYINMHPFVTAFVSALSKNTKAVALFSLAEIYSIGMSLIDFALVKEIQFPVYLIRHATTKTEFVAKFVCLKEKQDSVTATATATAAAAHTQVDGLVEIRQGSLEIDSPYVVRCHQTLHAAPQVIVQIIEYCSGGDLCDVIEKKKNCGGIFSNEDICKIIVECGRGLKAVHDRKIIHRDIKPRNILLSRSGQYKIADFGVSVQLQKTVEMTATFTGTFGYIAPEIYSGRAYSAKVDIYSFGLVLYEMVMLNSPFDDEKNGLINRAKASVGNCNPLVSSIHHPALLQLISSMLSLDPEKRPTVEAMLNSSFIRDYLLAEVK